MNENNLDREYLPTLLWAAGVVFGMLVFADSDFFLIWNFGTLIILLNFYETKTN